MTPNTTTTTYRTLPDFFYSNVDVSQFPEPKLWAFNTALGHSLGLTQTWAQSEGGLKVLSGQAQLGDQLPLAMAYGGHQFGQWSGLLGDGRARLIADIDNTEGNPQELHLKGAGTTPYSRRGDGKATLGSAIREYIVSEAMAALGVPTTRALSVVTTGEIITRNSPEAGAVLCRSAKSHLRVGTFQLAAASGETDKVKALADFAIERLYPDAPAEGPERYVYLLKQVISAQAALISKWMGLGFIHGVMNTDNTTISGETIDYGPCAYMDDFHPAKVFSSIDRNGRYAWNRQPEMINWNLVRFAEALLPLLGNDNEAVVLAEKTLETFSTIFEQEFNAVMAKKFGLTVDSIQNSDFLTDTFKDMAYGKVDFTLFFRHLTNVAKGEDPATLIALFSDEKIGERWVKTWKEQTGHISSLEPNVLHDMMQSNPIIIPRNHRIEEAIADANSGNFKTFEGLLEAVTHPFDESPAYRDYEAPPNPEEVVQQTFCGT